MRIGFLVDGRSEYQSLPQLLRKCSSPHDLITGVLLAPVHPEGPAGQIATQVIKKIPILAAKNADRIIVLLDHEQHPSCPGGRATEIESQINGRVRAKYPWLETRVIMKVRCFENWLISDVGALGAHPRLFQVSSRIKSRIEPDKADNLNALSILRQCCCGGITYEKVPHSNVIRN